MEKPKASDNRNQKQNTEADKLLKSEDGGKNNDAAAKEEDNEDEDDLATPPLSETSTSSSGEEENDEDDSSIEDDTLYSMVSQSRHHHHHHHHHHQNRSDSRTSPSQKNKPSQQHLRSPIPDYRSSRSPSPTPSSRSKSPSPSDTQRCRHPYKCQRCGQPKKGHICSIVSTPKIPGGNAGMIGLGSTFNQYCSNQINSSPTPHSPLLSPFHAPSVTAEKNLPPSSSEYSQPSAELKIPIASGFSVSSFPDNSETLMTLMNLSNPSFKQLGNFSAAVAATGETTNTQTSGGILPADSTPPNPFFDFNMSGMNLSGFLPRSFSSFLRTSNLSFSSILQPTSTAGTTTTDEGESKGSTASSAMPLGLAWQAIGAGDRSQPTPSSIHSNEFSSVWFEMAVSSISSLLAFLESPNHPEWSKREEAIAYLKRVKSQIEKWGKTLLKEVIQRQSLGKSSVRPFSLPPSSSSEWRSSTRSPKKKKKRVE